MKLPWMAVVGMSLALAGSAGASEAPAGPAPQESGGHLSRGAQLVTRLREMGWSDDAAVAGISALPIIELRGAIPVGIGVLHMPWWRVFLIAVVGNMIPVPLILLFLGPLSRGCMRTRVGRRFFEWLFARTRRKTAEIEKYETLGLAIFVAIPLPATGAWTGAMAAFLMGIGFKHALFSIFLGVLVAGIIMTVLSLLGWIGAVIAGIALLAVAAGAIQQMFKREEAG